MTLTFNPRELIVNFANDNKEVQALQFIRDDPAGIDLSLIDGNGMVNYLFKVKSVDTKSSIVVKYGEDKMRLIPEEKVSLERQELEYNCLCLMHKIQPGSAPEPYCMDRRHNMLAMADMSDWDLLGLQLERRYVDTQAPTDLGHLFGKVHRETSKGIVSETEWEELQRKFNQVDPKEYMRGFTFDRPLIETDSVTLIAESNRCTYHKYVKEIETLGLQNKLNDLFEKEICFVHGDCHYKSIFVKDGQTALLDFEFAFLGHPAYHVAYPVACYIVSYIRDGVRAGAAHTETGPSIEDFKAQCIQAINDYMEAYLVVHREISNDESKQMTFLSEVILFTGSVVFMVSTFDQMDILVEGLDETDRGRLLHAGFTLLKGHDEVKTLKQFMEAVSSLDS